MNKREPKVNELKLEVTLWGKAYSNQGGTFATRDCTFNAKKNKQTNAWESKRAKIIIFNSNGENSQLIQRLFDYPEKSNVIVIGRLDGNEERLGKDGKLYINLQLIAEHLENGTQRETQSDFDLEQDWKI